MPPFVYRITKYDPAHRDERGHYTGAEDTVSDHGPIEEAYLAAIAAFAEAAGIDQLEIREPQIGGFAHFGLEPPVDGYGLADLFPAGLAGFHDGAPVPIAVGLELVRSMLRDNGVWCRLEAGGAFAVHVGWDQYIYIGSNQPCETALARTRALGLFPERLDASPYDFAPDDPAYVQRPADADFWDRLHRTVSAYRAVFLEEVFAGNASRWHRLTRDNIETVRSRLAPRAQLAVWADLLADVDTAVAALPDEGLASPFRPPCRPRPGPAGAGVPRCRRPTKAGAVRRPSSKGRTVRQVPPLHAGPHPVQDPVDHLTVIPSPATTPVADRQERPQLFPLSIRQVTPPHARNSAQGRSSHLAGLPGTQACQNRQMVLVGEFFLAGDDESAMRVGPRKSHDFPAVPCDGIYPDDAVLRWEVLLTGAESPLRHVVPMANDGFAVFAVPQPLCTALIGAGTDRLRTAAITWAGIASEMGDEVSPDSSVDLLERLSALASSHAERGLSLYCWYFAP
ncbi:hypothetical protein ACFXCU_09025 [Streptomyces virginiae]|uniref:hypothetical protein n=1 Tax=Streptomyces virginiae TaxID=1961 RepID=UPI0036809C53